MKKPLLKNIPWEEGLKTYFPLLQGQTQAFCLASPFKGRFSYLGFDPLKTISIYPDFISKNPPSCPPFIKGGLGGFENISPSPFFASGWVGFLGYEMAAFADKSYPTRALLSDFMLSHWGLYDPLIVLDHQEQKAWISSWGLDKKFSSDEKRAHLRIQEAQAKLEKSPQPPFYKGGPRGISTFPFQSNFTPEQYKKNIRRVLEYIAAGDCYQVNFSQRFSTSIQGDENWLSIFWELIQKHPAPYCAFLDCGDLKILSLSPEELCTIRGLQIQTQPIKGSRKRSAHSQEDQQILNELIHSKKDQAELLMIVDLERNDLGKICRPGSIHVPLLRKMESFDYIHHGVATIQGELQKEISRMEALRALFPGGSITGAPKRRGMEIIQELEPCPRGVYTGAIGFFDFSPFSQWNIAIRTLEVRKNEISFGVGGGIVAESDPDAEYEETLIKSKLFLD